MNTQTDLPTPSRNLESHQPSQPDNEVSLLELMATFWEGRYLILGALTVSLAMGGYYAWRKSPIYRVEALVQVEDKKAGKSGPTVTALEGIFEQPTKAQAEIEIVKSNRVLGRAVESLALDVVALPDYSLFFGDARVRNKPSAPELLLEKSELPRGFLFQIVAGKDGAFRWEDSEEHLLAQGKVGEDIKATWRGQPMLINVGRLTGEPGQTFNLSRQQMLSAIQGIRSALTVVEKGKMTNILALSFEHRNPARGAEILNEILGHYVRQNIERKAEEASKTLAFLQEQMPELRGKLDVAEEKLNQYRMTSGSVDLTEEARMLLKQSVDLEGQLRLAKQKKDELLRTYQEGADVVATLNEQIGKLQGESKQLDGKVRGLPRTQQEVVRLSREVQVNNDLYTALLNSMQQLQVAKAGEIGNVRIVDYAMPALGPVRPDKRTVIGIAFLAGLLGGMGLTMLRRALHQGVEDPRLIESRLGLPVMVTIPHSEQQETLYHRVRRHEEGCHLLAKEHPEDLAVESLRSLRTSLAFTMMDSRNKVIMISGPSPGIGKSFVSSNLAAVLAQVGAKVLLVDGDMRKGNIHHYFGLKNRKRGLSEILAGILPWRESVHETDVPGLEVIPTGTLPPNPSELLMSGRFADFVQEVSEAYDLVILDAPPVLAVTDPVIIGGQVGTVLLLAKSKVHPIDEIRTAMNRFDGAGIKTKGCIFNDVVAINVGYRYYRYTYHYGYGAKSH